MVERLILKCFPTFFIEFIQEKDVDNERYFIQGDKVPFVEDERHDFR